MNESVDEVWSNENDYLKITEEPLNILEITQLVERETAGAIASFIGTTRNTFEGKTVVLLEYESYIPMALKEMAKLCKEAREKWPDLQGVAVYHRIGKVPVKEASVVVTVSSAHRKQALDACAHLIDRLKEIVPIWKKECYSDGTSNWKQNCPGCHSHKEHHH
jgi:molybdopterin synthase catalytic subunit